MKMQWAWFVVAVACLLVPAGAYECSGLCAYSQGYWTNHNKYESRNRYHPWPYGAEDTAVCGKTLLEWISEPSQGGDAHTILARQWIAAVNNLNEGRCTEGSNDVIVTTVVDAAEPLVTNCTIANMPPGELKREPVYQTLLQYAHLLDQYNAYGYSSPHCEDEQPPPPPPDCDDLVCETKRICRPATV